MRWSVALSILIPLLTTAAFANGVCPTHYSLEESARQANLIIIGFDSGATISPYTHDKAIGVAIKKVLKGDWQPAMAILETGDRDFIETKFDHSDKDQVFLIYNWQSSEKGLTTVFNGCGVKTLPIENGQIIIDKTARIGMTIDEFVKHYISSENRAKL